MSHASAPEGAAEAAKARLRDDLRPAMKNKDGVRVRVLRALMAELDNAQAVAPGDQHDRYVERAFGDGSAEVPRLVLTETAVQGLFQREIEARRAAAAEFNKLGQLTHRDELLAEAAIIATYVGAPD